MSSKLSLKHLLMLAALSVALSVAVLSGLVLSPVAALANTDDTTPSEFRVDEGDENGRNSSGGGANGGGLNADPNDWDVDSWDRGTIELTPDTGHTPPVLHPALAKHQSAVAHWIGWMRSLIDALKDRPSLGR